MQHFLLLKERHIIIEAVLSTKEQSGNKLGSHTNAFSSFSVNNAAFGCKPSTTSFSLNGFILSAPLRRASTNAMMIPYKNNNNYYFFKLLSFNINVLTYNYIPLYIGSIQLTSLKKIHI